MLEFDLRYPISGIIFIVGAVTFLKWFDFLAFRTIQRLIDKTNGKIAR